MIEGLKNAIIIDGVVYEFIDDDRPNECEYCDLKYHCRECSDCLCLIIFKDTEGKRFKERTDL